MIAARVCDGTLVQWEGSHAMHVCGDLLLFHRIWDHKCRLATVTALRLLWLLFTWSCGHWRPVWTMIVEIERGTH